MHSSSEHAELEERAAPLRAEADCPQLLDAHEFGQPKEDP
jgi:hypothetical protein